MPARQLLVGLGNPGSRYAATRHNVGFRVLDELGARTSASFKSHKSVAEVCETTLAGRPVILARPRSFMNESGSPIAALSRFYKVAVEDIIIVHDELDLPLGTLRLKRGGGEGGHNGLKSATAALGSRDYARIRVGISRPPGRQDPADYVLREFAKTERDELAFVLDRAADAAELLLAQGLEAAQNTFNQ